MKWYNYGSNWINLEHVVTLYYSEKEVVDKEYAHRYRIYLTLRTITNLDMSIEYPSYIVRDAEFEKIKKLMGYEEKIK